MEKRSDETIMQHPQHRPLYGGIEAGGTKFVCAVASGPNDIRAEIRFPTSANPAETLGQAIDFFRTHQQQTPLHGLGVSCFGPVDPAPTSATFGHVLATPKPGWTNTDVVGILTEALQLPVGFDTDVNGAALGEAVWGAGRGLDTFVYLTVGTGVGGGAIIQGKPAHGLMHREMGHMRVPHDWARDPYPGNCPYHGDCWEGLVCGPAVKARWQQDASTLPPEHPAWELQADYLALGLMNIVMTLSPQRIVLGGGIMEQDQLFPLVRSKLRDQLNGYIQRSAILTDIERYIVPPELGNQAGVLGAIALAQQAAAG